MKKEIKKSVASCMTAVILASSGYAAAAPMFSAAYADSVIYLTQSEYDNAMSAWNSRGVSYLKVKYSPSAKEKAAVKAVQHLLNLSDNAKLTEDGIYGTATKQAVKNFQRKKGLYVDGLCGKDTFNKLIACFYVEQPETADVPAQTASGSGINLDAARSYAENYWSNYNTDTYYSYAYADSDCCNFASQILVAAGVPETQEFHGSRDWGEPTSSFTYIPSLIDYMRRTYNVKYYNKKSALSNSYKDGSDFSITDIVPGDTVTINGTYGRNHIMYVLGVSGQYVYFTAHTNNRFNSAVHISAISGLLKTSDIQLQKPESELQEPETTIMLGDVNGDGKITITDYVQLMLYVRSGVSVKNPEAADINGDGAVDETDIKCLNKIIIS